MPLEGAGISRGWQHQRKIQPGTSSTTHERPLRRYHVPRHLHLHYHPSPIRPFALESH